MADRSDEVKQRLYDAWCVKKCNRLGELAHELSQMPFDAVEERLAAARGGLLKDLEGDEEALGLERDMSSATAALMSELRRFAEGPLKDRLEDRAAVAAKISSAQRGALARVMGLDVMAGEAGDQKRVSETKH